MNQNIDCLLLNIKWAMLHDLRNSWEYILFVQVLHW
jgi:hypothetical protein